LRLNDKKILAYSLIIAAVLLAIFPLVRTAYFESSFIGEEPYYHQRIADHIIEEGIPKKDPMIDRPYFLNPYHLVLAGIGMLIGTTIASFLLPFIFGLITVYFFYLIIKNFKLNRMKRFLILLFLIISPPFIYLFSVSNAYSLAIFMSIIGFYLFTKKGKTNLTISLILLGISALFGIMHTLIIIFVLMSYSIKSKNKLIKAGAVSFIILIVSLAYELPFLIKHKLLIQTIAFSQPKHLVGFISDLGGITGFGIFTILLMIFGLYIVWKTKKQSLGYLLLFASIAGALFYSTAINMYLVFPFAIFAGFAFFSILKMRWTLNLIKQLAVIVIIAGILFSTISYVNQTAKAEPTSDIIESLEFLKNQSNPDEIIFSHFSKGVYIQSIAQRQVLLDSLSRTTPDFNEKLDISNRIFYSRTLKNTTQWLNENNISYIWIDAEMKNNLVWTREEEGLLFLFRNNETFKNIYNEKNIEIWKVINK
jgi:hypothetical protein